MAYQLIYTSVRRGLIPGRSGYTVAARHRQIRDRLVAELERISSYTFAKSGSSPVVFAHRKLSVSGTGFHVLSRIVDAGSDYTGRTNHLAHHLVCGADEVARCEVTPAGVMRQFAWRDRYDEEPRYLGDDEIIDLAGFTEEAALPGKNWGSVRGAAADAALPLEGEASRGGVILVTPAGWEQRLLGLFAESQMLAALDARDTAAAWQFSFTTYLQPADDLADFQWIGCVPDHPLLAKAGRRVVIDLGAPAVAVPSSGLARLAETGRATVSIAAVKLPPPPGGGAAPVAPAPSKQPSELLKKPVVAPSVAAVPVRLTRPGEPAAGTAVFSDEPYPTTRPVRRSPLRDPRVYIPSVIAVFLAAILILHLTRNVDPWEKLKADSELALGKRDLAGANRILDRAKQQRPAWAQRIESYREEQILPLLVSEAEAAIAELRDAPDAEGAERRLDRARSTADRVGRHALAYPGAVAEAEVADLDRRIDRLMRQWQQRPDKEVAPQPGPAPRIEPRVVEADPPPSPPPSPAAAPRAVALPRAIYLTLNRGLARLAIPESLPDLTQGPSGAKKVSLEQASVAAQAAPWELSESLEAHEYKFPETAAEDDGRAMSPLGAGIDVQLRFEGKSRIELEPIAGGGGGQKLWGAGENCVLRFTGGADKFWIWLWNGQPLAIPPDPASLELRGSTVVPTGTLQRFLAALTPPVTAPGSAKQLVMRYVPPVASGGDGGAPIESAPMDLPIGDAAAIAIDFSAFSAERSGTIAKLEAEIEARRRAIDSASAYLDWRAKAGQFDTAVRQLATAVLGENSELLIRYPSLFDKPTAKQRRLALKDFCADLLRDFRKRLDDLLVERKDLDVIHESLSQDEFWRRWDEDELDAADGDAFAEFMANFGEDARKLSTRKRVRAADEDEPFKVAFRVGSAAARAELITLADAWQAAFAAEAGSGLWQFTEEPQPKLPAQVESIGQFKIDVAEMAEQLAKLGTGSAAMAALEDGALPPGSYQFELIMSDGAKLGLITITTP